MVVRHSLFNLMGLGIPLLVAVATMPVLINALGLEKFGLLTLIWAFVRYFGLLDMGIGRALTQQLSVALAKEEFDIVGRLVTTASILTTGLGIAAGLLIALSAKFVVYQIDSINDKQEVINALYGVAVSMPAIILTANFRGVLEARHAFGIINLIRFPMGIFTFLGPWVVIMSGCYRLDVITFVLAGGRILACVVHAYYAWKVLPDNRGRLSWCANHLGPLCKSGGWLSVSSIVGPFMGYVDRFVIGIIISPIAVSYYVTPQELITKLWIIPGALTSVLFPTFAAQGVTSSVENKKLFNKSIKVIFWAMLPIVLVLFTFAHNVLAYWITPDFADHSAYILKIFTIGILINCLAHIPYTFIQSMGKPKVVALIHLIELPLFVVLLWWLTVNFYLTGAAIAWLVRITFDAILMFWFSQKMLMLKLK
jgi:O-antigen/teichoic acid export membrane protein